MIPTLLTTLTAVALQIPGGFDLGVLGVVNVILALVVGYLIYQDAQERRTDSPALWAVALGLASLLLSFLGFLLAVGVYYFVVIRD
ncbi:hypothetical protein [Halobaculum limi]|uniref:hypothetical protein n=1 Tax=Halobaculum limi TaxID=3031916 RepID=UPI002405963E|nr:hypothetical protein [Halobaculum sp. YSMS11]